MVAAHYIQCASARKTDSIPSRPQIDTLNLGNQSNSGRDSIKVSGLSREQIITEWLSRFLGEDECTQSLCGHVDPAFLFSSQASTKIKGPESQFGTRILGFYLLTKWIR